MRLAALRGKRTALVAGVAVVGLSASFLAQSDAAVGTPRSSERTFTLVEQPGTFHFVDLPPMQKSHNTASAGDEVIFVNKLMKGSTQVGSAQAVCIVTRPGKEPKVTAVCTGSFMLRGGQLTVATTASLSASTLEIAITGGTGKYEGASGQVTAVNHPDGS
ncbi:MAG TPA: dirigent protein, partial [Nocardioidaceae bacterium]|nr:dirigent protein [Nocardioidaceae bacterium]